MSKIGFIGLGVMGTPMALHLPQGGHTLSAHSRSGVPLALQDAGMHACAKALVRAIDPLASSSRDDAHAG